MSQQNNKTQSTTQQASTSEKDRAMTSTAHYEGSGSTTSDTETQAIAYLFGLLPTQDSQEFEHRCQENPSCHSVVEDTRGFQDMLNYWTDVPAPSGLGDRTLARIQKQIEDDKAGRQHAEEMAGPSA